MNPQAAAVRRPAGAIQRAGLLGKKKGREHVAGRTEEQYITLPPLSGPKVERHRSFQNEKRKRRPGCVRPRPIHQNNVGVDLRPRR